MRWSGRARRSAAVAAAVTGLLMASPGGATSAAVPTAWSQGDHDAARSRFNRAEATLTAATVNSVVNTWSFLSAPVPNGSDFCDSLILSPVVTSGGRLFVVYVRQTATGRQNVLTAFDERTGKRAWTTVLNPFADAASYPGLSVSGGRVFVQPVDCNSVSDPTGLLQAFDARTGAPLWEALRGFPQNGLVVSGSRVVVSGATGASGSIVTAIDTATGASAWFHSGHCGEAAAPVVVRNLAFSANCASEPFAARQVSTGAVLWTKPGEWQPLQGDAGGSAGRHLFAIADPHGARTVTDLNPATGAVRYTLPGVSRTLAVDDSRVYGVCGSALCVFDKSTGAPLWQHLSRFGSSAPRQIAVAGSLVYLDDGDALDAATGGLVGDALGYRPAEQLVVGDGRIVAVSGRLLAVFAPPA